MAYGATPMKGENPATLTGLDVGQRPALERGVSVPQAGAGSPAKPPAKPLTWTMTSSGAATLTRSPPGAVSVFGRLATGGVGRVLPGPVGVPAAPPTPSAGGQSAAESVEHHDHPFVQVRQADPTRSP